ncbi:MAG TPA: hypothetical protein PLD10_05270 [Rhodopila sp.]|nr:hypothetical protein [Rhodopila sp.]
MIGFSITLEARNPERDHYRAYRLEAAPDLFGVWLVEASFGPIGCTGRTMTTAEKNALMHNAFTVTRTEKAAALGFGRRW